GRSFATKDDWMSTYYNKRPWADQNHGWTAASASFPADRSPYGIMHLGGNVWEWCEDWYHPQWYSDPAAMKNPVATKLVATELAEHKVARGGSWLRSLLECRAASRHHIDPSKGNFETG